VIAPGPQASTRKLKEQAERSVPDQRRGPVFGAEARGRSQRLTPDSEEGANPQRHLIGRRVGEPRGEQDYP
jgi:hypothetical protein